MGRTVSGAPWAGGGESRPSKSAGSIGHLALTTEKQPRLPYVVWEPDGCTGRGLE